MSSPARPIKYRRIAHGTIAMIMRCSLWLGDDHLLSVKSTGYTEEYVRIYLKDLKGVVARRTRTWMLLNVILGSLLALFGIGILSTNDISSPGTIALFIVGTPLLIVFLVNLVKGPTCKTNLLTPLGLIDIPALQRSRKVTRLIKELRPLVAAQQGSMLRSELLSRYDNQRTGTPSAPAAPPTP
ncbi:C2 domain-containing protein [Trichlorobacter lovleyi]|uniref:Transmembrane protein n=1 Tax=Trichlorobacter lovleyi (strain ATCC BAA-1151 / DSM 17278 / SZ) TaxID=398767 RepID=B3E322_TRIL1|nr:hypothetical protein [Trichlorobacter lovleyi]ACD97282.1 hypothetical protein Glov_3581 [Trichlorobacter lovleyi SZ]